jgi:hypothetical protein
MAGRNPDPVEVAIIAKMDGLFEGLGRATAGVRQHAEAMQNSFGGLGNVLTNLRAPFLALGALAGAGGVLAGMVAIFDRSIEKANEWNSSVAKLARTTGGTLKESSGLAKALEKLGIDQEVYTTAAGKMVRQILKGEESFKALGIAARDQEGNLRPANAMMMDAVDKLNRMKDGTDKLATAQKLFGRGGQEVLSLLRLTSERIHEGTTAAEKYNMVVSKESVAASRAYKESLHEMKEIFESLEIQLGQKLIPVVARLAWWLGEHGPAIAGAFADALMKIHESAILLGAALTALRANFASLGSVQGNSFGMTFKAAGFMAQGEFSKAWQTIKDGGAAMAKDVNKNAETVKDAWESAVTSIIKLYQPLSTGKLGKGEGTLDLGLFDTKGKNDKHEALVESLKLDMDSLKNYAQKRLEIQQSITAEEARMHGKGSKEYIASLRAEEAIRKEMAAGEHEVVLENSRMRMDSLKNDGQARLEIQRSITAEEARIHGMASKEYISSLRAEDAIRREMAKEEIAEADRVAQAKIETMNRLREYEDQEYQDRVQRASQAISPFTSVIESGLASWFDGTKKYSDMMAGIWTDLGKTLARTLAKMLVEHTIHQKLLTILTTKGEAERLAIKTWSTIKSLAISVWGGIKEIAIHAWKAAAAAYAAIAGIPVVGPVMAPVVAALALAAVMSLGKNLVSASGGYDIPAGVNPVVQAHAREMVLPEQYADVIRGMSSGGGGGNVTIHITAMDGADVRRVLSNHQGELVRAINEAARMGRRSA